MLVFEIFHPRSGVLTCYQERRNPAHQSNVAHPSSALLLVGQVKGKICILVDDLADTSNTITRAAKLLKKEGAEKVYALVTHGVLSGDGVDRIFYSGLDKVSPLILGTCDSSDKLPGCRDQ